MASATFPATSQRCTRLVWLSLIRGAKNLKFVILEWSLCCVSVLVCLATKSWPLAESGNLFARPILAEMGPPDKTKKGPNVARCSLNMATRREPQRRCLPLPPSAAFLAPPFPKTVTRYQAWQISTEESRAKIAIKVLCFSAAWGRQKIALVCAITLQETGHKKLVIYCAQFAAEPASFSSLPQTSSRRQTETASPKLRLGAELKPFPFVRLT